MDYRIETSEIRSGKIPEILVNFRNAGNRVTEIAVAIEIGIQPDNIVTSGTQNGPSYSANITLMTSKQYFHATPIPKSPVTTLSMLDLAGTATTSDPQPS